MAQPTAREDLNKVAPQNNFATPELLDKVRSVESTNRHIDPRTKRLIRSPTGAEGAYQILPSTQKRPGYGVPPVRNRTEAEHRRFAGDYLNALSRKYGDGAKTVVAYNQGPGTVDRAVREAEAAGTTWYAALEKKEGRDYLVKVLGAGAIPSLAVAQAPAPTPEMSRPVTVNPTMRAQVERIREQRASARAAPGVAPVDKVSALTPVQQLGVDKVGAGFQAALGFSMLGASGRGLPTAEDEAGEETAELADEPMASTALTAPRASTLLQNLPTLDAFAGRKQEQPVQMAGGGSLDDIGDDVSGVGGVGVVGGVGYNPMSESTQDMPAAPQAPQIKLRRTSASKSMGNIGDMDSISSMSKKSKSTEKEAPKGTARQQLEELQYKTGLTSAAIKDKLRGLGEDTFGAPTLTSSRGKLTRGPLAVASFDEGGEAKKSSVGVAAKLLDTFNEYSKKAEEFGLKTRDFMVENMISPTDIATMVLKVKRMVPAGALTYSGGLNEGEDEQIAKMREAARQQQPQRFAQGGMSTAPVSRVNGSPETGETGAAYGNPNVLAQGEKIRARRALEQVKQADQQRKDDLLARGRMERYDPVGISQNPYKESDTSGPQTLDEAAGLDPKVDRNTFFPYSKKEGLHVPSAAVDLMKLATASDPRYSHLMQPEEAMPLSANLLGGGFGASMATKAAGPGTLGMFIGPSSRMWRKKAIVQAEKMEAEGRTPEEIWNSTFSARAPWDNQWRQRISDISMSMTGEKIPHQNPLAVVGERAAAPFVNTYKDLKNLVKTGSIDPWVMDPLNYPAKRYEDRANFGPKDVPLTEQVSWPRLQNAYPGLLESIIIHSDRKSHPQGGYHDQRQVLTEVAPGDFKNLTQSIVGLGKKMYKPAGLLASKLKPGEGPWDAKSVLAHETMHRIQSDEGFGLGSSPKWAVYQNPDRYAAARHQIQLGVPPPSSIDKFLEKHRILKSVLPSTKREKALRDVDSNAAYNVYQRVGGEAEARLVQAEKNMSQDALDSQYPYDPKYFKEQTGVDISTVFRKEGSPEEGERSMGDRLKGYGETAASLLSGLGASIPAGYSGLVELARTRDPEKAAEEVGRRQAAMTYEPRTASGKKSTESAAALLENLNIPAQYVGDKAFEASGESPLAGAAAQTLLDPLNFILGAKAMGKGAKAVGKSLAPTAGRMLENRLEQLGMGPMYAVKPYKGTFARNSPEFLASKEHPEIAKRTDNAYVSNLEKYYAEARKQVKDNDGFYEETTPAHKQAMQEFYDTKAMPYFEEFHGTLRDPVFESLMEGRITPYGSSAGAAGFRPYMLKAAKRKTAESKIRYPADPDAYADITNRYDIATGLTPTLYYTGEPNLIKSAIKQNPLLAPSGVGGTTELTTGKYTPNKSWNKDEAATAEKSRVVNFINEQLTKQQEALSPQLKNQNLNPPSLGDYGGVNVKEPGNLNLYSDEGTKIALSDLSQKLSGGPAPYQTTPMRSADVKNAKALLDELKQQRASLTDQKQIDFINQQMRDLQEQVMSKVRKTSAYNVSDKMLEAMSRNEPVWDISDYTQKTYGSLNFLSPKHLNDYMRTLSPEKIRETPFAQMVEESSKHQVYITGVNQLLKDIKAGKSVDPKVFSRGMSEPVKTYENGFRWVKANDESALKLNGMSVGHCLKDGAANCSLSGEAGGTGRKSFDSGDTEIYFLQDARGVPVTTLEVINAKDPTKRTISQTKGNGTKTGDTAPVDYDSMVYDLAKQLNPVKIIENAFYLSDSMQQLKRTLNTPPPELPFKRGGAVSAARLLKEMPRTQHAY